MRLRQLSVKNFRGIRQLDWRIDEGVSVLIGPGDSGKSTVLDAVEFLMSPKWALGLNENDFFRQNTAKAIIISGHVSDLPAEFHDDQVFGLHFRGLLPDGTIVDEPRDGTEPVLGIRLTVDPISFEPRWDVFNDRRPEGRSLTSTQRARFGLIRLGDQVTQHLRWGRGSALTHFEDREHSTDILHQAVGEARAAIRNAEVSSLDETVRRVRVTMAEYGLGIDTDSLETAISLDELQLRNSSIGLHLHSVPLGRSGLGTRRLAAVAIQHASAAAAGPTLVDEIETGLEPHRLRHLIRILKHGVEGSVGQVFLTTHSPVAATEFKAEDIAVVRRSGDGDVTINRVPGELQKLVRGNSESLFAKRVVVCEGRTEIGLLLGLSPWWEDQRGVPPTHKGAVFADGNGSDAVETALRFHRLGYECCVLLDSDRPTDPGGKLRENGIPIFEWGDRLELEQCVFQDLPEAGLRGAIQIVKDDRGEDSVLDQLNERAREELGETYRRVTSLDDLPELMLRAAGTIAAGKGWYKQIEPGRKLGQVVAAHIESIPETALAKGLAGLEGWIYDDSR